MNLMSINTLALLLGLALSVGTFSERTYAEVIKVPIGQQGNAGAAEKPQLGMTMELVEKEFGVPVTRSPARGKPPIIRWEYNDFVVYFEGTYVIHSIIKHRRKD